MATWGNLSFCSKVAVRSQSMEALGQLQEVDRSTGETTDELVSEGDDEDHVRARSGDIYGIICQCCSGEALTTPREHRTVRAFSLAAFSPEV